MISIESARSAGTWKGRQRIFSGQLLLGSGSPSVSKLAEYAQSLIDEYFHPLEPCTAQHEIDVDDFIARVAPLKSRFTNSQRSKELIQEIAQEFGCDANTTYFDVPRLRVVPSGTYLSSGVSYAYKAHRDTWYSSPSAQLNWWLPVFSVTQDRAMSIFPGYWDKAVQNSSEDFDYQEWCETGRKLAVQQVAVDARKHPLPLQPINLESEIRFAGGPGDLLLFSAAQLHATAPNTSGQTRFSIDFRTVDIDDLLNNRGAPNIDGKARGSTLGDFFRVRDFEPVPASLSRSGAPE